MESKLRGWINLFLKIMCDLSLENQKAVLSNASILVCPEDIFELLKKSNVIESKMNEFFFCFSSIDYGVALVLVEPSANIKNGLILKC